MTKPIIAAVGANRLFDAIIASRLMKTDAELSRFLEVAPPVISKIRHGRLPVGDSMILRIHEKANIAVRLIREFLAIEVAK